MQAGFLLFPNVQQLDFTGPYEIFASVPGAKVHCIWKDLAPIASVTGLELNPTVTLRDCPPLDVLCVPGGGGINALLEDREIHDFLRAQAGRVRFLTSVCTGSLVLGAAGLLAGRKATTHWASHHLLARFGAEPVHARVVRDGNLITAGGVTAGIDFALTVVAELAGRAEAEAIQLRLEYAPDPPFRSGTPAEAPSDVLASAQKALAPVLQAREAIIAKLGR